jgi:uncharacterized protein involved in outer membrane biogenesis
VQVTKAGRMTEPMPAGRRIRWARATGAFLLVLLVLLAAVLTWLVNDTERVRHTIEDVVSAIRDRPFTIEGEFDYELGRIMTVRAGKIRWRNSPSNTSPYMLEIEQFAGSFDLLSLFDRPIVVTEVQAHNAMLLFEWDDYGGFNWRLGTRDNTSPKESAPRSIAPDYRPGLGPKRQHSFSPSLADRGTRNRRK